MKAISLLILLAACASREEHLSPEAKLNRKLQQCYEESDSYYHLKAGTVKYKVVYDRSKNVKVVDLLESGFSSDRNFEACISGVLKETYFKSQENGKELVVVQQIRFKRER